MKKKQVQSSRRILWVYAAVLAFAVLTVISGIGARFFSEEAREPKTVRTTVKPTPEPTMTHEEFVRKKEAAREQERETEEEATIRVIQEHRTRIESDLNDPERPALLQAMGNLYRHKLNDYENAAWCFQQIVQNYPEWPGTAMVYGDLATCYELLGDTAGMTRTYMEMMRVLPDYSQEYLYAKEKLESRI